MISPRPLLVGDSAGRPPVAGPAVTFDSFGPPKTRLRFVLVRQMHLGSAEAIEEENRVVD